MKRKLLSVAAILLAAVGLVVEFIALLLKAPSEVVIFLGFFFLPLLVLGGWEVVSRLFEVYHRYRGLDQSKTLKEAGVFAYSTTNNSIQTGSVFQVWDYVREILNRELPDTAMQLKREAVPDSAVVLNRFYLYVVPKNHFKERFRNNGNDFNNLVLLFDPVPATDNESVGRFVEHYFTLDCDFVTIWDNTSKRKRKELGLDSSPPLTDFGEVELIGRRRISG